MPIKNRMRAGVILFIMTAFISGCEGGFSGGDSPSNPPSSPSNPPSPIVTNPASTTFIYRVGPNRDAIYRASVNLTDGSLTEHAETVLNSGDGPVHVAISPDKKHLIVSKSTPKTIDTYSLDQTTGEPTFVDSHLTTSAPIKVRFDPTGRYLYVVEYDRVESFTIAANGTLAWTGGVAIGTGGRDVAIDATGKFLYKAAFGTGLQSYEINQSNGTLMNAGIMQGVVLNTLKIDPATNRIFGPLYSDGNFYQFAFNGTTGVLSFVNSYLPDASIFFPFYDLELNSAGTKAYAVNNFLGLLRSYSIDAITGAVSSLNSVSLPSGCLPEALERLKAADFLYTGCTDGSGKTLVLRIESDGTATLQSSTTRSGTQVKSVTSVTF